MSKQKKDKGQKNQQARKLVGNSDLGIPYTTPLNRSVVHFAQWMLGIDRLNRLYDKTADAQGVDFAEAVLQQLDIRIEVDQKRLDHIPRTGPFLLVANHPQGALDGLLLIALIARIRPDVKFLGNFLLTKIVNLSDFFLPVDPFNAKNGRNISGIRKALAHLRSGAPLVIFPAGEVSTFQKGFRRVSDKPWSQAMVKFIRQAEVPIVPCFIDGRNSLKFHLVGKIHPLLRTVRLPLELLNKSHRTIGLSLGSPVPVRLQQEAADEKALSDCLRANVYSLAVTLSPKGEKPAEPTQEEGAPALEAPVCSEVIPPIDRQQLLGELEQIPPQNLLLEAGKLRLYAVATTQIPLLMREIARLREITFRSVGEGTLREMDSDQYDSLYHQLFIWDTEQQEIAGAYRVGFGDLLMEERGLEGFYSHTLFEFSNHLRDQLVRSIELGRSFVTAAYQRSPALLLLWRGILLLLLQRTGCRYLIGPVSISSTYTKASKWLIINHIKKFYWNEELAGQVMPRHGLASLGKTPIDPALLKGLSSMEWIDKLIRDIEPQGQGMPVLIKKYLQLGGQVMGFNVDPLFNDSLDAMLIVDLTRIPKQKIDLVAREITGEGVYARFRDTDPSQHPDYPQQPEEK